jgi:hypothetical protein
MNELYIFYIENIRKKKEEVQSRERKRHNAKYIKKSILHIYSIHSCRGNSCKKAIRICSRGARTDVQVPTAIRESEGEVDGRCKRAARAKTCFLSLLHSSK